MGLKRVSLGPEEIPARVGAAENSEGGLGLGGQLARMPRSTLREPWGA